MEAKELANNTEYFYLASPYTNPDPKVVEENYKEVLFYSALLFKNRIYHFCPIAACHVLAKAFGMLGEHDFWKNFDDIMVRSSGGVIVADIMGWKKSAGVKHEINLAREIGLPVYLCKRTLHVLSFTHMEE